MICQKKKIINKNFYYASNKILQPIRDKNKIKNIKEYEEILESIISKENINKFKKICKSILIKNENIKYQITNPLKYNIVDILLWLLYFLQYTKIDVYLEEENINDFSQKLKSKKKIIILRVKNKSEINKAEKIMNKYTKNNYIIKNYTTEIMSNISVIDNMEILNLNTIKKYINKPKNDDDILYEIFDLLDNELVMMIEWINENNILKKNINKIKKRIIIYFIKDNDAYFDIVK